MCACARRVYLSVILVFYFLCAQTRTITLNCASLCFAPFLSHSLCLSFFITLPFFPHFPQRNEFLLFTRLCLITLERKGEKKRERRERGYIQKESKKRIRRILVLLYTNAIKKRGMEGHDAVEKKTHSSRRGEGEGSLNKLISTIGFLEAGMVSCDWPKEMEWIVRRGL